MFLWYVFIQFASRERLMIGVQSISMLEGAFERTRSYTKDRMVFGKPLIQLQVSIRVLK